MRDGTAVLGIDVGGTHVRAGRAVAGGVELLAKRSTPNDYGALLACLAQLCQEAGSTAVAIGLPGVTGPREVSWIPNLRYLDGRALAADLESETGAAVTLANDAQMALVGECWQGAAAGCQNAILISLGTGIGGAILADGRVLRGATGSAGALGWLNLDPEDAGDENHGYLERHASGRALERLGEAMRPPLSSYELVEAARCGDRQALEAVHGAAKLIGAATAGLVSVLDPEVVLVSGGLSRAFDLLEAGITAAIRRLASPSGRRVPLRLAALGEAAGIYGAVRAALDLQPGRQAT